MYKHVLIPTDGSDLSSKAEAAGLTLAKGLDAKVTALTVTQPFQFIGTEPMMLLSGAFTPPESQGALMRTVGLLSPVRHYVDFGYQVLFKGNGLAYVWDDVAGILALGVALFLLSVRRFARLVQ